MTTTRKSGRLLVVGGAEVPDEGFTVHGSGALPVFDGRVSHTSAPETARDGVLAITDSKVHVLPAGYSFDLRTARPRLPGGKELPSHVV